MEVKDLRIDSGLSTHINDGSVKYAPSSKILQTERKTFSSNIELQPLGKLDTQSSRPCAIIGPDRVLPPTSNSAEGYGQTEPEDLWPCSDVYRQLYELPLKMSEFPPTRNISPRQTFQENMQRIMVPPTYSSMKSSDEPSLKNNKLNMPPEAKYCDVPFNSNNEHKTIRNSDISVSNVNSLFPRSVPGHGWQGVGVRPLRPYPAPEFYQYPEYSNMAGPRQMPVVRPQRGIHEEPGQVYSERLYQEANLRFKPYPTVKDRYPHTRYEYIGSCPNTYPPPPYPPHKSLQNHPYSIYPQVPLKYLDRRMPEPVMDGFQRPSNPHANVNTLRNHLPPPYGPVPSNCYQNKPYPYQSDSAKSVPLNKLPYETNNRVYLDLDNCRPKMYPPENFYYSDRSQLIRGDLVMSGSGHPPVNSMPQHQMYRKDNPLLKNYDYASHYRLIDQPNINNSSLSRLPLQFSPNAIAVSPCDSNASNETAQTLGTLQEDCGYVSQSSTTSLKSFDNGITNDIFRRNDYPNMKSLQSQAQRPELNCKTSASNKKGINVRQFLQSWNEGDEDTDNNNKEVAIQKSNNYPGSSEEQLYVLGLVNVPNEELAKYEHLQKLSKLPENIKGYNYIELLNQYEQIVESPSFNNSHGKPISKKEYPVLTKNVHAKTNKDFLPRPLSPLDVEAKISQSVIHKEVGCNFEIKPCSPKLLNVDIATPVHDIMTERLIEKVTNPVLINVANVKDNLETSVDTVPSSCNLSHKQYSIDSIKSNNYNLQDLETNTSVCLASLPQLDNDIELNFPEVNQQFIDSTRTDKSMSKSTNFQQPIIENKLDCNSYPDSSTRTTNNSGNDKESSKLSKYRKTKKIELPTRKPEIPVKEAHSPSSNQQRIDSVIIKNPDNTKVHSNANTSLQNNKYKDIGNERVQSPKYSFSPILGNSEETGIYYKDLPLETAIDFSLNKTENNFSNSDCKNTIDKYEDSITVPTLNNLEKTNEQVINNVQTSESIYKTEISCELKEPLTSVLDEREKDHKIGVNPDQYEDCIIDITKDHQRKTDKEIVNESVQNKMLFDKKEIDAVELLSDQISNRMVESETTFSKSDKYEDCIIDTSVNDINNLTEENSINFVQNSNFKDNNELNIHQILETDARHDTAISEISALVNNEYQNRILDTIANHRNNMNEQNTNPDVNTDKNEMKSEINEHEMNIVAENEPFIKTYKNSNKNLQLKESGQQACVLSSEILDVPESNEKCTLNESVTLNNNVFQSNSSNNNSDVINETLHKTIDPLLSTSEMSLTEDTDEKEYVKLTSTYLSQSHDTVSNKSNNDLPGLCCNSPLDTDNVDESCKDNNISILLEENCAVAKNEKSPNTEDYTIFKNKSNLQKCNNSKRAVNESVEHNNYKEKEVANNEIIIKENQSMLKNDVTMDNFNLNTTGDTDSAKNETLLEKYEDNVFKNNCETLEKEENESILLKDKVNALVQVEYTKNDEDIIKDIILEDKSNVTQEKEVKSNYPLKEKETPENDFDSNTALEIIKEFRVEREIITQDVTDRNCSFKQTLLSIDSQYRSCEQNDENSFDVSINSESSVHSNDTENSTKELLFNMQNNLLYAAVLPCVEQIDKECSKVEIETESILFKPNIVTHEKFEDLNLIEYDQTEDNDHVVIKEQNLKLIGENDTILTDKIVSERNKLSKLKQSKEMYSPWIQKLLLYSEGLCLPKLNVSLNVEGIDSPLSITDEIALDDQVTIKNNYNSYDIKTIDSSNKQQESDPKDHPLKVLEDLNRSTVISKEILHQYPTDLETNQKEYIQEQSSNNLQCIENISDICNISEDSKAIEKETLSDDVADRLNHEVTLEEKVSTFEDAIVIKRKTLKRSLSESALEAYSENEDRETLFTKRPKLIRANLCSIFQNNRRNSISEIYNEDNVYILIGDNNYVLTEEDEREKLCYADVMHIDSPIDTDIESIPNMSENYLDDKSESCDSPTSVQNVVEKEFEETWVDDDCIETMFNDDIAEDIVISAPGSPDNSTGSHCDTDNDTLQCEDVIEHMEKVKDIYGGNMCNIDAQLVETLYRTPQMNVNKTLVNIESPNIDLISLKDINCNEEEATEDTSFISERSITPIMMSEPLGLPKGFNIPLQEKYDLVSDKKYFEAESISKVDNTSDPQDTNRNIITQCENNYVNNSPEVIDGDLKYCDKNTCSPKYCISSSPEVTSTTSEEKSILLKISSLNGSRISRINETDNKKISYKLTESNHYKTFNNNYNSAGVLITKAAQKYIPPIKETISNLKVKLHLPQHSLNKLKQLKKSKVEPKIDKKLPSTSNLCTRQDIVKKQKPKFEDVLMNIDKIQLKKCKEKLKKVKDEIPKVVIKKNESGAHYASSSHTNTKNKYNPDLTGRKWQPWVFLEKNNFVDKMAMRNKIKAVYCHRKKTYVLSEKFRKYKSVYNAKFVISQPKPNDITKGNLKYTIRLKAK